MTGREPGASGLQRTTRFLPSFPHSVPLSLAPPAGVTRWRHGDRRRRCHVLLRSTPSLPPLSPPSLSREREKGGGGGGGASGYNDPSAGSPTETLLRLLLPLDDGARRASGHAEARPPDNSPQHPIGRSDGRCVQRAGTHSARDH